MTIVSAAMRPGFDEPARAEIGALLQANQAREALERLCRYEARDREQRIHFHGLRAKALDQTGDFGEAIREWVRALHHTSRHPALRPRVRPCLADTLTRIGELARAERVVQRGVAEIRAQGGHQTYEPWALGTLARIHLRRGTLTLAARLLEKVFPLLGDSPDDPVAWAVPRINFAHVQIRLGEFERADRALSEIEHSGRAYGPLILAPLVLTRVLLGLESGALDLGEQALARVDDRMVGDHLRFRLVWLQYDAALRIARGRSASAIPLLEEALRIVLTNFPMDDMVAELLRLKASALLDLGRSTEALDVAHEAVRACRGSDMLDHPAGLRIVARCLVDLGRDKEAKAALGAAFSLLESTEFVVERRKLVRAMESMGMLPAGERPAVSPERRTSGANTPTHRFELADGRRLLTSDDDLAERIRVASESRLPVLLEGETGTGKELVARLLHEMGNARDAPFVVVDCTTLSETLAEAELFGVARGAYTGAVADRVGLVTLADQGTLFFDELPELTLPAQSKLLRLLQEGTFRRLGEARPRQVHVRVIASTNQDAERLLARGKLKADLFFRLHGYRIRLRPLRERPADVRLLTREFAVAEGLRGVTPEATSELLACPWPGNVRQLQMLVRVAASMLGPDRWLDRPLVARLLADSPHPHEESPERWRLKAALEMTGGNVAAAARELGMSRQGLYKALHRHHLI